MSSGNGDRVVKVIDNIKTFRDLRVWQKSHEFVLDIYRHSKEFPDNEKFGLQNQIRRAAVSICANIVEGYKKTRKDFIRYLRIAEASLEEVKYFLILCLDLDYLSRKIVANLTSQSEQVGRMIYYLRRSLIEKNEGGKK